MAKVGLIYPVTYHDENCTEEKLSNINIKYGKTRTVYSEGNFWTKLLF